MNIKLNKKIFVALGLMFFGFAFGGAVLGAVLSDSNGFSRFAQLAQNKQAASLQDIDTSKIFGGASYVPAIEYENAVIKAVEKASPAVVSIIITAKVPVIENCPVNPFSDLPEEFRQFFDFGGGSTFYQPCEKGERTEEIGGGSGFIISSDGVILTNKHVVSNKNASYTVLTNDGKKYDAKVIGQDPVFDLAIVKINGTGFSTVTLGSSDGIKMGQSAIAIGNALGEFRNTVSVGVVSGLARNIVARGNGSGPERIEGLIQTDAAINSGNSGGPLLNLRGEVIGVNIATVMGAQNIGFAIPINQAKRAIESVKRSGEIVAPYLGVRTVALTNEIKQAEKLSVDTGALVKSSERSTAIVKNSPAEKAGLKEGDVILEVNREKVTVNESLTALIQQYNVGDRITLKVLRGNKEISIPVILEKRPQEF